MSLSVVGLIGMIILLMPSMDLDQRVAATFLIPAFGDGDGPVNQIINH